MTENKTQFIIIYFNFTKNLWKI